MTMISKTNLVANPVKQKFCSGHLWPITKKEFKHEESIIDTLSSSLHTQRVGVKITS